MGDCGNAQEIELLLGRIQAATNSAALQQECQQAARFFGADSWLCLNAPEANWQREQSAHKKKLTGPERLTTEELAAAKWESEQAIAHRASSHRLNAGAPYTITGTSVTPRSITAFTMTYRQPPRLGRRVQAVQRQADRIADAATEFFIRLDHEHRPVVQRRSISDLRTVQVLLATRSIRLTSKLLDQSRREVLRRVKSICSNCQTTSVTEALAMLSGQPERVKKGLQKRSRAARRRFTR